MVKVHILNNRLFAEHVLELLKRLVISSMEISKLIAITDYINGNLGLPVQVTGDYLVRLALQHLILVQMPTEIIIEIDTNFKFYGFKLITLVDMIECGTIEIGGYPLFSKCSQCISTNIEQIYYEWKEGY